MDAQKKLNDEVGSYLRNHQSTIQNLELQVGRVSQMLSERSQGELPTQTQVNPKVENVKPMLMMTGEPSNKKWTDIYTKKYVESDSGSEPDYATDYDSEGFTISFEHLGLRGPVSTSSDMCTSFSNLMTTMFEMSMLRELSFFLGLQVLQKPDGILNNQSKYIGDLLKNCHMNTSSVAKTPMALGTLIGVDPKGKPVDHKTYRAIIGSLLYLTASRPDIMFATCFCARFQANPKESHMMAVKRILRYLKGTPNRGLWYPKESGFELIAFSDADHGGCQLDRKSTSGHVQFLGDKLKQHCVSTSTAEAEYVTAASCCSQVLWMRTQLRDYGYNFNHIPIYRDSKSAIAITCNPVQHTRTKHIDIRYHFIKDHVERGTVEVYFVNTEYQLADLFTKPLDEKRFNFLISKLGMYDPQE
ncbi:hypothetical protein OSB04_016821 [Centaurea solstitialis]|uniref:Reverse transcriptase Ty1/copia-type domain-containing protein n=1 Tax=Centaurea solstitialis TaxID=347529 RepID=A0AA38TCR6_9ASTR|nr:hypothetical protein OSB04_016821 [Centaurea solstitialis]